ncbi:unnamed protein product [Medioppia subpectinata]|uniref:Uncharacterized protein n=1 Tax=Medioppia subpectinata TaxID=1979941 RepID=A0A7R9KS61_9ACAR|nr:unnamed protein product [Medioppia subpectinata]CAG2108545.1 unnamed protein product [Medioppia subpectinata]
MSQLDSKMNEITGIISKSDRKFPENENQLDHLCQINARDIAASRKYMKRCTTGTAKTIISVSIHSVEKMNIKTMCKIANERRRVIQNSKCYNRGKKELTKCWTNNNAMLMAINNVTDAQLKIPLLCW